MSLHRLDTPHGWTASVLGASAAQRAATLLSTLYFVRCLGSAQFAAIVPLMPIAPIVNAMVLMGQDQSVLRVVLQGGVPTRLGLRSTAKIQALVVTAALLLGTPVAVGVTLLFHVPLACAVMSASGGLLLSLAQATSLAQVRASQSGVRYMGCYAVFGATAVAARIACHYLGMAGPIAWSVGDLAGGLSLFLASLAASPPRRHGGLTYRVRDGLNYGLPLFPNAAAQQVLGNGDRWIFAGRVPAADLATYVSAYQVANIVNIMLSEVNRSRQHRYVLNHDTSPGVLERGERLLLLGIVAAAALPVAGTSAALSGPHVVPAFWVALGICASFTSIAYYLPVANLFSMSVGDTRPLAVASVSGAVANMIVNIMLVGVLGIWAGVIANFIGYALMYVMLRRKKRSA